MSLAEELNKTKNQQEN